MTTYNRTIFIIDDDPKLCDSLRCVFESADFIVETFMSAQHFFERHNFNDQECIILDVRMPQLGEIAVLDYVHGQKKHLPMIIMRNYADIPEAIKALRLNEPDFTVKPFNQQILSDIIQTELRQWVQLKV